MSSERMDCDIRIAVMAHHTPICDRDGAFQNRATPVHTVLSIDVPTQM
jgi:hypothetical protein